MVLGCEYGSRRWGPRNGTAILESALLGPLFLLLIAALVHFAFATMSYNILSSAVRDGARYASVHGSSSTNPATQGSMQTYVQGRAIGLIQSQITVTTTWTPNNHPGSVVKIQGKYTVPSLWDLIPGTVYVASVSQMAICR